MATLKRLKKLGIPVFMAVGKKGCGKTKFFDMFFRCVRDKNIKVAYVEGCFSMAYVKKLIVTDEIEVILFDESEDVL